MRLVPYLNALVGAVIAGAIATAFLIPALPFVVVPRGRRERYIWWTNTGASYGILRYALRVNLDVVGRDHIPFGQPYMVVANHRSWVDVITLIWAARAEGLSKREVFFTPVMGVLGYLGGAVFFNRDHAEGRRRAKEECLYLLKQGVPLHIYPEGTRTRDGKLREKIHLAMLEVCWEHRIPLVPAALWGTERVVGVPFRGVHLGETVHARFRPPLDPALYPNGEEYAKACWAQVTEMVNTLESEYAEKR